MIGVFLGIQNSGKTLSMTYFAKRYFNDGYTIYSNYNLEFPHTKLTRDTILSYTEKRTQFNKAIFCIDEIYLFFDSRNFSSKANRVFSYFLVQSAKNDVHIFGTAQFINTIEKRFRDNLTFRCFCQRVLKVNNEYREIEMNIRFLPSSMINDLYIKNSFLTRSQNSFIERLKVINYYIKAKECFKLFNTKELIGLS